ncbi:GWxTD domain-containing protein [Ekhidna lutea]|uniref:GWxTD domain-containing protein n=1 Tax=Ekhidna lutea TaxID=447679 RepID=A0A239FMV9_EKHLU|nr:GWxTD domain-containing protein [Ekhidna lutea]SNS57563.1 GWxTD domain-containing protein [Ekhidna lutea]
MRKQSLLILIFLWFWCFSTAAINFSRVNVAWQYDVSFEVRMSHRIVKVDVGNRVFLEVRADSLSKWKYEFLLQKGYQSDSHRQLEKLSIDTLLDVSGQVLIQLDLPGNINENLLVVKFSQPDNFYYYDINLMIGTLSFPSIYPVDENGLPILENYINRTSSSWVGNDSFLAMQYADDFAQADLPMADMKPLAPQVDMDTSYVFNSESNFKEGYFYVVRRDSLATTGVTILRVPPYFPEYRQLSELIESMLYLTSEQEKRSILSARNPRESFDSFWMNTYSTKSRARNAIRKYYNWIESTNRLFTDFKPGWKTDRGMIYIGYGAPDEVYRTESAEEWFYDQGAAFEFTIISTFFAPKTYTLRRNGDLGEGWFSQITAIRQGIR